MGRFKQGEGGGKEIEGMRKDYPKRGEYETNTIQKLLIL